MARDLDIAQLRTLVCVAEHRNMTYAANMRNLTQSAVSQQIKRLEETLGCSLLVRKRSGVELTKSGIDLLPFAREIIERNDILIASISGAPVQSDIRLGVPQDVVASLLPEALKSFHASNPQINVTLVSDSTSNLISLVENHQVDLALTTDNQRVPDALLIRKVQLKWIGATNGSAFRRRPLPVAVGQEGCSFRQAASKALTTKNIAWRPVTQVGSLEPVYATLLADIAVAPFIRDTNPAGTQVVKKGLPALPGFYIHLRKSQRSVHCVVQQLSKTLLKFMAR